MRHHPWIWPLLLALLWVPPPAALAVDRTEATPPAGNRTQAMPPAARTWDRSQGTAPVPSQSMPEPPLSETAYPYVLGLGAIAGVLTAQAVLFGTAGFPILAGSVAANGTVAAEVSVGISRLYAVTSAVVGAWIANWLYDR